MRLLTSDKLPASPGRYDLVGDVHVTNELQARFCTVKDELNATGTIEFNPIDPETKKISQVVVNGGIYGQWANIPGLTKTDSLEVTTTAKMQELTVFNIANVNKFVVNNGVTITGDLVIENGSIKANGTTITFKLDGMHVSSNLHTPDTYVND